MNYNDKIATAMVQYTSHRCHLTLNGHTHQVIIFKCNDRSCDFAIYSSEDKDDISDYIMTPLVNVQWGFQED